MARNAIVFVHGRGEKPGREPYTRMWLDALQTRVAPEFSPSLPAICGMGYYADVFYQPQSVGGGASEPQKRSVIESLFSAFAPLEAAAPVAGTQDSPAKFIEDVLKYFAWDYNGVVAKPVIAELDGATAENDNVMVISHSMGTMVMYDVLADHPYHLDTWITLGSPLGSTQDIWAGAPAHLIALARNRGDVLAVVDRTLRGILEGSLAEPQRPIGSPQTRREYPHPTPSYPNSATVDRWININNRDDPVAKLDPQLTDDFPAQDGSLRAMDVLITNPGRQRGDAMSAHSDPGYLSSWQVGQLVTDFLLRNR